MTSPELHNTSDFSCSCHNPLCLSLRACVCLKMLNYSPERTGGCPEIGRVGPQDLVWGGWMQHRSSRAAFPG